MRGAISVRWFDRCPFSDEAVSFHMIPVFSEHFPGD